MYILYTVCIVCMYIFINKDIQQAYYCYPYLKKQ